MTQTHDNPYAAPTADIAPEPTGADLFAEFPRFSAWWVFLLGIVTFNLYAYYWFFSRSNMINRALPENQISSGLIWSALTVVVVYHVISVFSPDIFPDMSQQNIVLFGWAIVALTVLNMVLWFAWVFTIRNRINRMTSVLYGDPLWVSGPLTFFFSPIYLAYKINQIKDSQ